MLADFGADEVTPAGKCADLGTNEVDLQAGTELGPTETSPGLSPIGRECTFWTVHKPDTHQGKLQHWRVHGNMPRTRDSAGCVALHGHCVWLRHQQSSCCGGHLQECSPVDAGLALSFPVPLRGGGAALSMAPAPRLHGTAPGCWCELHIAAFQLHAPFGNLISFQQVHRSEAAVCNTGLTTPSTRMAEQIPMFLPSKKAKS